jgi:hypothetical protein
MERLIKNNPHLLPIITAEIDALNCLSLNTQSEKSANQATLITANTAETPFAKHPPSASP